MKDISYMHKCSAYCLIIHIHYYSKLHREQLGLLKAADGDKIVEDPIIESFYKVTM